MTWMCVIALMTNAVVQIVAAAAMRDTWSMPEPQQERLLRRWRLSIDYDVPSRKRRSLMHLLERTTLLMRPIEIVLLEEAEACCHVWAVDK